MECQPRVLNLAQVMSFQHIPERTLNESSFDTLDGSEILRSPSGMLKNSMNNGDKLPIYTSTGEFTGFLVAIIPVVSSILLDHFVGEIHSQSLPFSNFDLQDKCVKSVGVEPTGRNGVFLFEKNGGRLTQKLFENSCDLLEVTKAVFKKDIVDVCISIHCKKHVDYAFFLRIMFKYKTYFAYPHNFMLYKQTNPFFGLHSLKHVGLGFSQKQNCCS